jgi:hypothetical protein
LDKLHTGRKPKYEFNYLVDTIKKYIAKHPNERIALTGLERSTGIPRHIWKDNKKIRAVIDEINNPPVFVSPEHLVFTFPNAQQLVESHYNNKQNLIRAIQDCFDTINDLYDKAVIGVNIEAREKELREEINELKVIIKQKEKEINVLNHEIDLLYLESESPTKRKNLGLKENLIELNLNKERSISKNISDLKEEFKNLFD